MPDLFDLSGRVALVTGGSRGLGRQMVLAFAAAGADIVIASRKLDACEELAREIHRTTGRRALAVAAHVGRWGEVERLVDATYDEMGRPDSIDRVNGGGWTESTWWYFSTGRACRFRDGRLVQVQEFDPVRAF